MTDVVGAPHAEDRLDPGLYLVATPIGHAQDITLRALDVLARADAIAAEDTRETAKLMGLHGIERGDRPLIAYHDQNGQRVRPQILEWLGEGMAVAYCSDAGTPLIADPGYRLVEAAIAEGHGLTSVPGASAVITALSLSGLPTDRFLFLGFLPSKSAARQREIAEVASVKATLVIYESPRRTAETLADLSTVLGAGRQAVLARELTKHFEEVRRGSLGGLAEEVAAEGPPKGEVVLLVGGAGKGAGGDLEPVEIDAILQRALTEMSVKDAARDVAQKLGLPRKTIYARALELSGRGEADDAN